MQQLFPSFLSLEWWLCLGGHITCSGKLSSPPHPSHPFLEDKKWFVFPRLALTFPYVSEQFKHRPKIWHYSKLFKNVTVESAAWVRILGPAFIHCIHLGRLLKLYFSEIITVPTVWRTFWRLNEWMDIKNLEQWLIIIKRRINLLLILSIPWNLRGSLCWVRLLVRFLILIKIWTKEALVHFLIWGSHVNCLRLWSSELLQPPCHHQEAKRTA